MKKWIESLRSSKEIPAILAALGMTALTGLALTIIALNALLNPKTVPVASAQPVNVSAQSSAQDLQALVTQYQAREKQYQAELQQAADQLAQTNRQASQYRNILQALVNAGVIQITNDGRVTLNNAFGNSGHSDN